MVPDSTERFLVLRTAITPASLAGVSPSWFGWYGSTICGRLCVNCTHIVWD